MTEWDLDFQTADQIFTYIVLLGENEMLLYQNWNLFLKMKTKTSGLLYELLKKR